jgi:predicted amidohydrolase
MKKSSDLYIGLVQTDIFWKDKVANLAMLEEKIWEIEESIDLLILPEMFATGFSMDAKELAEPMNLTVTKWMKQMAAQLKSTVTGSVIISENRRYYNRLLWVTQDGTVSCYDKRHLFRMAKEEQIYSAGEKLPIFELKGWKICPQICYDLRFPVWSRNQALENEMAYDLIFYVASWPEVRISAWDALLPARAIENVSYSLGVNRIGNDGNGISYTGHSAVYDFKGSKIFDLVEMEIIKVVKLEAHDLDAYRKRFPVWMDSDSFRIL